MARRSIIVKYAGVSYNVKIEDLLYVESSNKKVILHTRAKTIEYSGRMCMFEAIQPFFRCHRCYIVNMRHVVSYSANTIALINGREILMSRRRYPEFVEAYMEFLNISCLDNDYLYVT